MRGWCVSRLQSAASRLQSAADRLQSTGKAEAVFPLSFAGAVGIAGAGLAGVNAVLHGNSVDQMKKIIVCAHAQTVARRSEILMDVKKAAPDLDDYWCNLLVEAIDKHDDY